VLLRVGGAPPDVPTFVPQSGHEPYQIVANLALATFPAQCIGVRDWRRFERGHLLPSMTKNEAG